MVQSTTMKRLTVIIFFLAYILPSAQAAVTVTLQDIDSGTTRATMKATTLPPTERGTGV